MKGNFSSICRFVSLLVVVLVMGSCSSGEVTPPKIPSADNSLSGSYIRDGVSTNLDVKGTDVILTFFNTEDVSSVEVTLVVPEGATLSNEGRSLAPIESSGRRVFTTNHNFSTGQTYEYTVTAENGDAKVYTLKTMIRDITSKEILDFVLYASDNDGVAQNVPFVIDETARSVIAWTTNVTGIPSLVPTITHNGKSISPASGEAQDFTTNLAYTVTAENDSTTNYTVTLNPYYSVVFDADGGSYTGATPTNYVRYSNTTVAPTINPTREHYGFTGWSATKGGADYAFDTPITSPTTLYAQWTNYLYTVTYNVEGNLSNVVVDSLSVLPPAIVPGYDCIGRWFLDSEYSTPFSINDPITNSLTLYGSSSEALGRLIARRRVPNSIDEIVSSVPADQERWRSIMKPYITTSRGQNINFRYAGPTVRGLGGTSWTNNWVGGDLRPRLLNEMSDASANNIYVLLVGGGNYKPFSRDPNESLFLKNYVAIVGGVKELIFPDICGTATTVFSGDIGTPEVDTDNVKNIFSNSGITNTAVLYGVTITKGYNSFGGAGMYNNSAHPTLIKVIFSENSAVNSATGSETRGGGMLNSGSSPSLIQVTFTGNRATKGGGLNNYGFEARPILNRVIFSGNDATYGGGMYNFRSSPTLTEVSFISNRVENGGGGMYNESSLEWSNTVLLNGTTFSRNTAVNGGGGIYNQETTMTVINTTFFENITTSEGGGGLYSASTEKRPTLIGVTFAGNRAIKGGGISTTKGFYMVNTLFWGNTATDGSQVFTYNFPDPFEKPSLQIYYSLVQNGFTGNLTNNNGSIGGGFAAGLPSDGVDIRVYTHDGTAGAILSADPNLGGLADNGGWVNTISIGAAGGANNKGIHVKRSGSTYYYSSNGTEWYSDPGLTTTATPGGDAESLTATDARGYARSGRPDIGAYESGGTQ